MALVDFVTLAYVVGDIAVERGTLRVSITGMLTRRGLALLQLGIANLIRATVHVRVAPAKFCAYAGSEIRASIDTVIRHAVVVLRARETSIYLTPQFVEAGLAGGTVRIFRAGFGV
jgi:hypothetical protein